MAARPGEPRPDDGAAQETALHLRIRDAIVDRIRSGDWPPGRRLPVEHELMADYGCSRATVNKALAPLAESGLIVRRRKAGSFVAVPKIHSVVLDIPDIAVEITSRGEVYDYQLLSRQLRKAQPEDLQALGLKGQVEVLALRCLHWAGGRPFALEERLINLRALEEAGAVDFSTVSPGAWLLGHVPWTEAEHRISASNAQRAAAASLQVDVGAACLVLERRTWRNADCITQVRLSFPAQTYDLVARFTPSGRRQAP